MRTIVMLDIDGTLVDPAYKVNSQKMLEIVKGCEDRGAIFSLNSNRALEDLLPLYEKFGLNGFIIGENGAFSLVPGERQKTYAREEAIKRLANKLPKILLIKFPSSELLFEDTVKFLQNPKRADTKRLFVANKFRKFTMSIFAGRIENGKFVKDLEIVDAVADLIRKEIAESNLDLEVIVSVVFGNVLINQRCCSKSSTLDKIMKERYRDYELVMISDDENDAMIGSVDKFYTVANAKSEIKEKADYASEYEYAKGVADILQNKIT